MLSRNMKLLRLLVILLLSALAAAHASTGGAERARSTFFISPSGNDQSDGRSASTPFKSFRHAFLQMAPGDELVLEDGLYSEAAGTGYISYSDWKSGVGGRNSGEIPSGADAEHPTIVRALNPGRAKVVGRLFIGRSFRKDSYIRVQGITFEGGGTLYNTSHVAIKDCGFHGSFGIGTIDHAKGNDFNLVEDVWVWASGERIIAFNYRADRNVWRRVLVRGDGCGKPPCQGSRNPNVGITVYESSDVSLQNVMVIDRVLAPGDSPYADFAVAQHTPGAYLFGRNEWLGTLSLKAPDSGYYFEPDRGGIIEPTIRIANAVAWDSASVGFNLARAGEGNVLENLTARALGHDGIRVAPELSGGVLRNVISVDAGRFGINSRYPPSHVAVYNARAGAFNQSACAAECNTARDPRSDGPAASLKHLVRIEKGSYLSGRGHGGADIGANILYRYGREGSRHGEKDFNALTAAKLWPWPNEARIQREMCEDPGVKRGFCLAKSLTRYVWEYLGSPLPEDPYAYKP